MVKALHAVNGTAQRSARVFDAFALTDIIVMMSASTGSVTRVDSRTAFT